MKFRIRLEKVPTSVESCMCTRLSHLDEEKRSSRGVGEDEKSFMYTARAVQMLRNMPFSNLNYTPNDFVVLFVDMYVRTKYVSIRNTYLKVKMDTYLWRNQTLSSVWRYRGLPIFFFSFILNPAYSFVRIIIPFVCSFIPYSIWWFDTKVNIS